MRKLSNLDPNQITTRMFDEESDAQRVVLVGDTRIDDITGAVKEALSNLTVNMASTPAISQAPQIIYVPQIVKETEIVTVEKSIVTKEVEVVTIEKPIITTEIQVVTIEKPVIVTEIKIIEIEKQVIIKEMAAFPPYLKIAFVIQTLAMVAQVILYK